MTETKEGIRLQGALRIHLLEDGRLVGDSGWRKNQITNEGVRYFLAALLGGTTGSIQVTHAALGSGAAPASDATALPSELAEGVRDQVSATTNGSTAVRFTGTFASGDSFVTATRTLSNIGLFGTSTGGTLFAGNTYGSSTCATNQNLNYTYDITFTR